MAIIGSLDVTSDTPVEALLRFLRSTEFATDEGESPSADWFQIDHVGPGAFADDLWVWRVTRQAGEIQDVEVPQVAADPPGETAGSFPSTITRGIVARYDDYGGFVAVADTEGESAEALSEAGLHNLEVPI